MNLIQITQFAETAKKGQIHTFVYHKVVKLAKKWQDMGYSLETRSVFQGMLGDYDNRQAVIEKRENGQAKGVCTLVEKIKDVLYENAQGEAILRVLPVDSKVAKKVWILNGEEVPLETIQNIFPKSVWESHGCPDCMSLKASNIVEIH